MFVVLADREAHYPNSIGECDVFGPFKHPLQAKDFADALLADRGTFCEVKEVKPEPVIGDEGL